MTAKLLDGKSLAQTIRAEIAEDVVDFIQNNASVPCLAAILVGDDPPSEVYVRNKRRACEQVGIESQLHRLPVDIDQEELLTLLAKLNKDRAVHGILVQTPLPGHIDPQRVVSALHPGKDVDAFHPENVGLMVQGRPRFLPCTPHGVRQLLMRYGVATSGKHVVIVGRSEIVGKPLAIMLAQKGTLADATVTLCHSRTDLVEQFTRQADIVVMAIGRPGFLRADMVRPGAVVVDVGINRTPHGLTGDVAFEEVREVASWITPVPGGVGPLTVTMLLYNTLTAAHNLER